MPIEIREIVIKVSVPARLPAQTPEWRNENDSDPGVTGDSFQFNPEPLTRSLSLLNYNDSGPGLIAQMASYSIPEDDEEALPARHETDLSEWAAEYCEMVDIF